MVVVFSLGSSATVKTENQRKNYNPEKGLNVELSFNNFVLLMVVEMLNIG